MTEIRDLTQHKEKAKEKKPIEFVFQVTDIIENAPEISLPGTLPRSWDHIDRIAHLHGCDIFHAWDDDESEGVIFIGHFNDGVV